jgi:hypothetical protein
MLHLVYSLYNILQKFSCLSNKDTIKIYISYLSNMSICNNKLTFFNKAFVKQGEIQENTIYVREIVYQVS